MNAELRPFLDLFREFTPRSLVAFADILLVAFLIYKLFSLIRGTRAWRIFAGIAIFVLLLFVAKVAKMDTLYWVLEKATILGPVALVILLLPELRQAIEGFGRFGVWTQWLVNGTDQGSNVQASTLEEIVSAVAEMSSDRIGALIVLEKDTPIEDVVASGVDLGAKVSSPLLVSLFYHGNPLHDGAVVIRGDQLVAAACRLPLSETRMDSSLHMRHRAAVGISEQADVLVIVVSEERGTVAIAHEGNLRRCEGSAELRDALNRDWRGVKPAKPERDRRTLFAKGRSR